MSASFPFALRRAAVAFRGYNQTNLGRTPELLAKPAYHAIVRRRLDEASGLVRRHAGLDADLVGRVQQRREAGLNHYAEAIALVFAAELAQLDLLREVHGVEWSDARLAFGYSLGELVAVSAAGCYAAEDVMRVPLALAADCAALAPDATMGVVFSRHEPLRESVVASACEEITAEGAGAIAISAILSPNTLLVIGEGGCVDRLRKRLRHESVNALVRRNDGSWPPLHTPLVCQRHVPDRATLMIRTTPRDRHEPRLPIVSLVTGKPEYAGGGGRDVLRRWVDHPQRLWDAVEATLAADVRAVLHVGPAPNVIPATFQRLADNVRRQASAWSLSGVGVRAAQRIAANSWLSPLLPGHGCLLRAPLVEHVVLEDWLLENAPTPSAATPGVYRRASGSLGSADSAGSPGEASGNR